MTGTRSKASRVAILPGTQRDLTYIAANMRDADWAEISCQLGPGAVRLQAALVAVQLGAWVATYDGQPAACFGFTPRNAVVLEAWAWGTERMARTVPAITRFVRDELAPGWIEAGVRRLEARSLDSHAEAHRWMTGTGAAAECIVPEYGCNGETFVQFAWTADVPFMSSRR